LAQSQQLIDEAARLVCQHCRDRPLAQRGHIVAALIHEVFDARDLVDRGDDPAGQLIKPNIDGVAFLDREIAHAFQERHIGADAMLIDPGVEQ
jgi:hypothetical protein